MFAHVCVCAGMPTSATARSRLSISASRNWICRSLMSSSSRAISCSVCNSVRACACMHVYARVFVSLGHRLRGHTRVCHIFSPSLRPSVPPSFLLSFFPRFFLPSILPSFIPSLLSSFLPSLLPSSSFLHLALPFFRHSFLCALLSSFLSSFIHFFLRYSLT